MQAQLRALTILLEDLRALLETLLACQALWLRLAPTFALPGAAQHMPSECLTFAQVLACRRHICVHSLSMVQCPLGIGFQKHDGHLMLNHAWAHKLYTAEASRHMQASQDWRTLMQQVAAAPSWAALAEQPEGLVKRLRELHASLQEAQGGTAAFCKV
jgi:hypothetical protein